jgi:hypothetical protein
VTSDLKPRVKTFTKELGHHQGWFNNPVYGFDCFLIWDVTPEQTEKYVRMRFKCDDPDVQPFAGCHFHLPASGSTNYNHLIALKLWKPKSPDILGTLAHECFHAATAELRHKGMKLSEKSEEAFAYLLGWFVRNCVEILNQK